MIQPIVARPVRGAQDRYERALTNVADPLPAEDLPAKFAHKHDYQVDAVTSSSHS